jgi:cbb3-type cytochrome oxidase subunit 3
MIGISHMIVIIFYFSKKKKKKRDRVKIFLLKNDLNDWAYHIRVRFVEIFQNMC